MPYSIFNKSVPLDSLRSKTAILFLVTVSFIFVSKVGSVSADTTPIMARAISVSAKVNAFFFLLRRLAKNAPPPEIGSATAF